MRKLKLDCVIYSGLGYFCSMQVLEANGYKIEIGSLHDSTLVEIFRKYHKYRKVIIVDENTNKFCLEYLITNFADLSEAEVVILPTGEENKQIEIATHVWEAFTEYGISRYDLIINLGGGIVTDMGAFIASCYKRGCAFINIPTSLLAMVDASVGGKTGVNLGHYKNQIGVFNNPVALYIDKIFLQTLPEEELAGGYAEMLKHGIIADKALYYKVLDMLNDGADIDEDILLQCIGVKNNIVNEDPLEAGKRKILNFGHTFGHVIEGYFMETVDLNHGHCVAIGMVMESYISYKKGLIPKETYLEIELDLLTVYPIPQFNNDDIKTMIGMLGNDKKNKSGKILCCLIDGIGSCIYDQEISEEEAIETFMYLENKLINLN